VAVWPNGTEAKLFGAHSPEDVERFRAGGNRCLVWMEELAAWRYLEECFEQIRYGLRVGPWPRWIGSTTPKGRLLIKKLSNDPKVEKTFATTADNPHLDPNVKAELYEDYEGTRMGRQELLGQILEDVEGALWTGEIIEMSRIKPTEVPEFMALITVAIDPAATASETSDETGIITVGMVRHWDAAIRHPDKSHGFVLNDRSGVYLPTEWGRKAIAAYKFYKANRVVGEINNGGEMVRHVIHSIEDTIPFKPVTATRGKKLRAEPISSLWAEERMHMVGIYPKLEDQMTTWDPENPDDFSPDRMDALVYAATDTMVGATIMRRKQMRDRRLRGRR
jgi:phage terminase large subunit-like protein